MPPKRSKSRTKKIKRATSLRFICNKCGSDKLEPNRDKSPSGDKYKNPPKINIM